MGPIGWPEMVIIFLVALILFGPKKLPELGRNLGKALTQFRQASNDLKSTWEREMQTIEDDTRPLKEAARGIDHEIRSGVDVSYDYGYPSYADPQPVPPPAVEAPAAPAAPAIRTPEGAVARQGAPAEPVKVEPGPANGTAAGHPPATA